MPSVYLKVNGPGTNNGMDGEIPNGSVHYLLVDDGPTHDGVATCIIVLKPASGTKVGYEDFTMEDFTPAYNSIVNVRVVIIAARDYFLPGDPDGAKARTALNIGGVIYYGTLQTLTGSDNWTSFVTSYSNNPQTTKPWTAAEINALKAGVELTSYEPHPENPVHGQMAECTSIYLAVEYTVISDVFPAQYKGLRFRDVGGVNTELAFVNPPDVSGPHVRIRKDAVYTLAAYLVDPSSTYASRLRTLAAPGAYAFRKATGAFDRNIQYGTASFSSPPQSDQDYEVTLTQPWSISHDIFLTGIKADDEFSGQNFLTLRGCFPHHITPLSKGIVHLKNSRSAGSPNITGTFYWLSIGTANAFAAPQTQFGRIITSLIPNGNFVSTYNVALPITYEVQHRIFLASMKPASAGSIENRLCYPLSLSQGRIAIRNPATQNFTIDWLSIGH